MYSESRNAKRTDTLNELLLVHLVVIVCIQLGMHLLYSVVVGLHPTRDLVHLFENILVEAATTLLVDLIHTLPIKRLIFLVKLQLELLQHVERDSLGCGTFFGQSLNQPQAVLRLVAFFIAALLEFAIVYE